MTRPSQKALELRQVQHVLRQFPDSFPGVLRRVPGGEGGEQDVILETADGRRIGIEVTSLRQPGGSRRGFTPSQIEASRDDIARWSREIHDQSGAADTCMNGYIGQGPYDRPREMARFIADTVCSARGAGAGTVAVDLTPAQGAPVELHLAIWTCVAIEDRRWSLAAVGETAQLERQFLQDVIRKKDTVREAAASKLDEVWLMIVSTVLPSSADFSAPDEAGDWKFQHGFDRVWVYLQGEARLLEY